MHAAPTLLAADRQPLLYVVQDVSLAHRNKLRYSALAASSITYCGDLQQHHDSWKSSKGGGRSCQRPLPSITAASAIVERLRNEQKEADLNPFGRFLRWRSRLPHKGKGVLEPESDEGCFSSA